MEQCQHSRQNDTNHKGKGDEMEQGKTPWIDPHSFSNPITVEIFLPQHLL
jgi:uncharacterized Fe-S cluster protein YjdI